MFDIDGTLMDSGREGHVCFRRALEDVYSATGPIESYDMTGKTDWQIVTELMSLAGLDAEKIEALRPAAFAAYARHVAIAASILDMRLLPGVEALLAALSDHEGFILGLVSGNVREAVPHKLKAVGLDPGLFQFGAFGSEHLDRNALPALALYRLEQMLGAPVPKESALVIGDTPRDIACARHTGVKVMCVATGAYPREELARQNPDYLLDDLSDIRKVMAILESF